MSGNQEFTNSEQHEPSRENIEKLKSLIKTLETAMLTTQSTKTKSLHSRPMYMQKLEFDGQSLWFFTRKASIKCDEVQQNSDANLSFSDVKTATWLSLIGKVTVVEDKEKMEELWNEILRAWFPKGLEEPDMCLLRFDIEGAEYWDEYASRMVQLYSYFKAIATGKSYEPTKDQNMKIDMGKAQPTF
ncbi:hypothetical protein AKO1_007594 [Acrasis kona]|uniref:General stress protein FMN-binding split barrel domain-containing protein n=1 Tax=Acrasis kona TaxID=1008807 RepID=A0AAW2YPX5_9EUKA